MYKASVIRLVLNSSNIVFCFLLRRTTHRQEQVECYASTWSGRAYIQLSLFLYGYIYSMIDSSLCHPLNQVWQSCHEFRFFVDTLLLVGRSQLNCSHPHIIQYTSFVLQNSKATISSHSAFVILIEEGLMTKYYDVY